MTEKRWLTKEERLLLKPHAGHYRAMYSHISQATIEDLERLHNACRACTDVNCGWDEYRAAQYLMKEIGQEIDWRNRLLAEANEAVEPTAHIQDRWADDGGAVPVAQ